MKIMEILRLWEQGYSQRTIAASVKCAKSTVGEVQRWCREAGLGYAEASEMTNKAIRERVYPAQRTVNVKADPAWEDRHARLTANRRMNLRYIWEEHRQSEPGGLGYSQFCRRYQEWRKRTGKEVVMVQEREPSKELFVDWMGDTLACVVDTGTGELLRVHFFVAVLGDSSYPYVEAAPDEKEESWLLAHVHALEWMGGVPRVIVPDNCKTAVTKPNYYDPKLNPAYWELAWRTAVRLCTMRWRCSRRGSASPRTKRRWRAAWVGWRRGCWNGCADSGF